MATLSDHLKPKMDALKKIAKEEGITIVEASRRQHRTKLERVSDMAVDQLETRLPEATIGETVKVYDTTRKHLNTLDGIADTQQQNIIIIPGEIASKFSLDGELAEQLKEEKNTVIDGDIVVENN